MGGRVQRSAFRIDGDASNLPPFSARYPAYPPETEFDQRYPPDRCAFLAQRGITRSHNETRPRFGEEAADSARVWRVYRDHVTAIDDGRLAAWNDTLGILLVFVSVQYMVGYLLT